MITERSNNVKRYWLFAFNDYEAAGGMDDLKGRFDTIEELTSSELWGSVKEYDGSDDYHIYDSYVGEVVKRA